MSRGSEREAEVIEGLLDLIRNFNELRVHLGFELE